MGLLNIISNEVKAAIGYQQNFADLLTAKDVTRALSMMKAHAEEAANNLREIEPFTIRKATFYVGVNGGKSPFLTLNSSMKFLWCFSMADP